MTEREPRTFPAVRSVTISPQLIEFGPSGPWCRSNLKLRIRRHRQSDQSPEGARNTAMFGTGRSGPVVSSVWASAVYFCLSGHLKKPESTSFPIAVRLSMVVWARFMLAALIRPKLVFMVVRIRPTSTRLATSFSNRPCSPTSGVL
jgi:hypothetical protein